MKFEVLSATLSSVVIFGGRPWECRGTRTSTPFSLGWQPEETSLCRMNPPVPPLSLICYCLISYLKQRLITSCEFIHYLIMTKWNRANRFGISSYVLNTRYHILSCLFIRIIVTTKLWNNGFQRRGNVRDRFSKSSKWISHDKSEPGVMRSGPGTSQHASDGPWNWPLDAIYTRTSECVELFPHIHSQKCLWLVTKLSQGQITEHVGLDDDASDLCSGDVQFESRRLYQLRVSWFSSSAKPEAYLQIGYGHFSAHPSQIIIP